MNKQFNLSAAMARVGCAVAMLALVACGSGSTPTTPPGSEPVATITLNQNSISLTTGQAALLTAATKDAAGNVLTGRTVTWTTSAASVASVDGAGHVTAVAAGTATITATSEGKSASANITVTILVVPVASVGVTPSTATLVPLQTAVLQAVPKDAAGNALGGRTITWASSATAIATVDGNGTVTAVSAGSATITATSEGKNASVQVTVSAGAYLGPAGGSATGAGGNVTVTLPAGALNSNTAITIQPIANPQVDPNLISGTAYDFGPTGTAFAQPVTLAIKYSASLPVGANPAQFRVHKLIGTTWTPLAGSTVNLVTLTVTAQTSSFSTYAVLQVPPLVTSVSVTGASGSLQVGSTRPYSATPLDAQGNPMTGSHPVTWLSLTPNVATVSSTGVVKAVGPGTATIRAMSDGINGDVAVISVSGPFLLQSIAPGWNTCGIVATGEAYCWGYNIFGELGNGTRTNSSRPVHVSGGVLFSAISAGASASSNFSAFACGVAVDGSGWCWGAGQDGQLGTSGSLDFREPVAVAGGLTFAQISAAYGFACGLTTTFVTHCWGQGTGSGTGYLGRAWSPVPVNGTLPYRQIVTTGEFSCGLTAAGSAWCWGTYFSSSLGDGVLGSFTNNYQLNPVAVIGGITFSRLAAGFSHVCGLDGAGVTWCWGNNASGQLGDGSTTTRVQPTRVMAGTPVFTQITGGDFHACGLTAAGAAWCWGDNYLGQVGDGTGNSLRVPTLVAGGHVFTTISAGANSTCGTTATGEGWCWGENQWGQLGDGTTTNRSLPVRVVGP